MTRSGLTWFASLAHFVAVTGLTFVILFATFCFVFPAERPPDDPHDADAASMAEMDGVLRRFFLAALLSPCGGLVALLRADSARTPR